MNKFSGWTEAGANFDPKLAIVRGEVVDRVAAHLRAGSKAGLRIVPATPLETLELEVAELAIRDASELEVEAAEQELWDHGELRPGDHIEHAFPGVLREAVDLVYNTAA